MANALMPRPWNFAVANVGNFTQPVMQGIEAGYRDRQQGVENERQNKLMGFQEQRLGMDKAKADRDAETAEAHQFGKAMSALASQPPEIVEQYAPQIFAKHPKYAARFSENGIPMDNPQAAVRMLAQQYGDYDPQAIEKNRAQTALMQAQAAAAQANAGDAFAVGGGVVYNKRTGAVTPLPENASKPDAPSSVREWQAFNMLSPADQERYLNMKRSDKFLDIGTGFVRPSQSNPTAPPIPVIDKNNAEEARQRRVGTETGELQMGAPKAAAALESADAKSDLVVRTIGEARSMIGATTAGMGGAVLSRIPGTAARDLAAKIDTLKANAGFGELQTMRDNSPTGGALGAVAVQELAMLQATIISLEQAQTPDQLSKALDAYETFIRESKVRRRRAFDATYGANRQQPPPMGGGITAPTGNVRPPGVYNWTPQGLTPAER